MSATTRVRIKIFFRGLGLVASLEDLDYFDGDPAE
jgi:hypothetical protein